MERLTNTSATYRWRAVLFPVATAVLVALMAGGSTLALPPGSTVEAATPILPPQPSSTARLLTEQSALTSPRLQRGTVSSADSVYTLSVSSSGVSPDGRIVQGWCEVIDSMGSSRATSLESIPSEGVRLIGQSVTCSLKGSAGIPLQATLRQGETVVDTLRDNGTSAKDLILVGR